MCYNEVASLLDDTLHIRDNIMPSHYNQTNQNPLQPFLDQISQQYPQLKGLFQRILNPSQVGKSLAIGLPGALKRPPLPGFGPASALGEGIASVGGGVGAASLLLGLPGESAGQTAQANNVPTLGPTNEYGPFAPGGPLSGVTDFLRGSGVNTFGGAASALQTETSALSQPGSGRGGRSRGARRPPRRLPARVPRRTTRRPIRRTLRGARPE